MSQRSLLEELISYVPQDKEMFLQSKGTNTMVSMMYFLEYLDENFKKEEADLVVSKIVLSIRTRNIKKFENLLERGLPNEVNQGPKKNSN